VLSHCMLCPDILIKFLKRNCWVTSGVQSRHLGRLNIFLNGNWGEKQRKDKKYAFNLKKKLKMGQY
jgi:hypothetical protein